jgi:hypothetical protein
MEVQIFVFRNIQKHTKQKSRFTSNRGRFCAGLTKGPRLEKFPKKKPENPPGVSFAAPVFDGKFN